MTTTANDTIFQIGLNRKEWAKWKRDLLTTGTYDPHHWDKLHSQQKWWTKETLNTLKSFKSDQ